MFRRRKRAAELICMLVLMVALAACGSEGSLQEKIDSAKETAEQKYNEFAENLQGENTDNIDVQAGYFLYGDTYTVVIKNLSEEKTIDKYAVKFEAYDAEDNPIEPVGFPPAATVGPVCPGKSAVMVDWGDDEWTETPSSRGYTVKLANWGDVQQRVYVADATENYYGNYTITIRNDGKYESDLQKLFEGIPFQFYAVFRDSEGNVTGVSNAYMDEFEARDAEGNITGKYPVIAAGEEITTTATVNDIYPGTIEITMVWNKLSQHY